MKYKTSLIALNISIPLIYVVVTIIPSIILGIQSTILSRSWFSIALGLLSLLILNIMYIKNWNFYTYLESKDWKNLHELLNKQLHKNRIVNIPKLMILLHSLTIQGEYDKMVEIALYVKESKPRIFKKTIAQLCSAFILARDYDGLIQFVESEIKEKSISQNPWADWFWSFAILRNREIKKASRQLFFTATFCKNTIIRLLSLYILIDFFEFDVPNEKCEKFLVHFRNKYTPASWSQFISKKRDQLHILVFEDFIQSAGDWCMKKYNSAPPIVSAFPEETDGADINYMEKIEELDED